MLNKFLYIKIAAVWGRKTQFRKPNFSGLQRIIRIQNVLPKRTQFKAFLFTLPSKVVLSVILSIHKIT